MLSTYRMHKGENMISDTEKMWELEKQLIACLDEIRTLATKLEGGRKVTWDLQPQPQPANAGIILLGNNAHHVVAPPSRPRSQQFLGGSLSSRLDYADKMQPSFGENPDSMGFEKNNLANEDRLLSLFMSRQRTEKKQEQGAEDLQKLQDYRLKANRLSCEIFKLRQSLGLELWLCDKTSAKALNIKMGGDGTFTDSDGNIMVMPETPLSQNCLGRKGQVGAETWIMECVLCPVNYLDTAERLQAWKAYFETRKDEKRKTEDCKAV